MENMQLVFTVIFIVIVAFNILKGITKNKNKTDLSVFDAEKSAQKTSKNTKSRETTMDKHADWDKAAWGDHKTSSSSKASPWDKADSSQSGHNIPTWDKPKRDAAPTLAKAPKWDEAPQRDDAPKWGKRMANPNRNSGFGMSMDSQNKSYSMALYLLVLAMLANLGSLIFVGYEEFEAAQARTGDELQPDFGSAEAYAWLVNVEMALIIVFIIGLIYTIYQWFEKSSSFRLTFLWLFATLSIFILCDCLAYNYFYPRSSFIDSFLPERDILIAITAGVFLPYVKFSNHVKAVFQDR